MKAVFIPVLSCPECFVTLTFLVGSDGRFPKPSEPRPVACGSLYCSEYAVRYVLPPQFVVLQREPKA